MAYNQSPNSFFRAGYSSDGRSVTFDCKDAKYYGAEAVDLNVDGTPTTFSSYTGGYTAILVLDNAHAGCRLLIGDWVVLSHSVAGFIADTPYYVSAVGSIYNADMSNPSAFILSATYQGLQIEATSATNGVAHVKVLRPHLNGKAVDFDLVNAAINFSTDNVKNTIHIQTPTGVESKLKIDDRVYVNTAAVGFVKGAAYWVVSSTFLTGAMGHDLQLSTTRGGLPVTITATVSAVNVGVPLLLAGPLNEIATADAHPTTGDWRKIVAGTLDGMYQKWTNLATADRPNRLSMTRTNGVSGNYASLTYSIKLTLKPQGVDAIARE